MKKLTDSEIQERLKNLPDWKRHDSSISKKYVFETFSDALIFANRLGEYAEEVSHHPELTLGWGYCIVILTTHDIGGISSRDVSFAETADKEFSSDFLNNK